MFSPVSERVGEQVFGVCVCVCVCVRVCVCVCNLLSVWCFSCLVHSAPVVSCLVMSVV
jgi:hypothetical protein